MKKKALGRFAKDLQPTSNALPGSNPANLYAWLDQKDYVKSHLLEWISSTIYSKKYHCHVIYTFNSVKVLQSLFSLALVSYVMNEWNFLIENEFKCSLCKVVTSSEAKGQMLTEKMKNTKCEFAISPWTPTRAYRHLTFRPQKTQPPELWTCQFVSMKRRRK